MNYLTEILEFYDWTELNPVDSSQICLWHALMYLANKSGWQDEIAVPMSTLEFRTGLKRSTIYTARNGLKQAGLITFKERPGNQSSVYRLCPLNGRKAYTKSTESLQNPDESPTQSRPYINKIKEKEIKEKEKGGADTPKHPRFVKPTVEEVKDYCKERGNGVDPETFVDFYTANGWKQGSGKPIVDWKAAVRTWERRDKQKTKPGEELDYG
ncbi:helix-turn-helix domain-containing protein [Eubacteriales bacterium OttesenSCG-928-M02]|nr:helix-turn-helix domain-containing protein [Eubacteriales bacterium OttesenSCG-928-M02]